MAASSPIQTGGIQTAIPCTTCELPESSPIHDPGAGGHAFEAAQVQQIAALYLDCPSWCTDDSGTHRDGHDWRAVTCDHGTGTTWPALVRTHRGPSFGPFRVSGEGDALDGSVHVDVDMDRRAAWRLVEQEDQAVGLRELKRYAEQAALWIEAHR